MRRCYRLRTDPLPSRRRILAVGPARLHGPDSHRHAESGDSEGRHRTRGSP